MTTTTAPAISLLARWRERREARRRQAAATADYFAAVLTEIYAQTREERDQ